MTIMCDAATPFRYLLVLLIILVLSGCATPAAVPEDSYFQLPAALPQGSPAGSLLKGVVGVARPVADGLHSERAILYTTATEPLKVRQYHYHFWMDSPPRLIQEQLLGFLRAGRLGTRVVREHSRTPLNYLVTSRIVHFERILEKGNPKVNVALELGFDRVPDEGGKYAWSKTYAVTLPTEEPGMYASVVAFGEALQKIYREFAEDLRTHERACSGRAAC
jgi:ABC-type uncharacterized transport system auxiliary subunit